MSKITESARGQDCQVRIIGVCKGDPAYKIWSHARHGSAGKGRGIKAAGSFSGCGGLRAHRNRDSGAAQSRAVGATYRSQAGKAGVAA